MHSTEVILLLWRYSTCRQLLILLTTKRSFVTWRLPTYSICCTVLDWFLTYLEQRMQHIRCRGHSSNPSVVLCGSLKDLSWDRSCLSSTSIDVEKSGLCPYLLCWWHMDIWFLLSGWHPGSTEQSNGVHQRCWQVDGISPLTAECRQNGSTLVCFRLSATPRSKWSIFCLRRYCQACKVCSESGNISGQRNVLEASLSRTVSSCFAALRQTQHPSFSQSASFTLCLVTSFVLSHLDYGSINLIGISRRLQDRLQSVLNTAARLVCNGRKYDHITPLLCDCTGCAAQPRTYCVPSGRSCVPLPQ